jgi:hypothetical protein
MADGGKVTTIVPDDARYTDESVLSFKQWVYGIFIPFLATKKMNVRGLLDTPPRKGIEADHGADDVVEYVAKAKNWSTAEANSAAKKDQAKMYKDDQQCGGYLITALQGSQLLSFVPHADRGNAQTIVDDNRFTAIAHRLMGFETGTTVDDYVVLERAVRVDLAYVKDYIRWPNDKPPRDQSMKYFSDVQRAADALNEACNGVANAKKIVDAELIRNAQKELQQLERYRGNDGKKLLEKLINDNATFKLLWMAVVTNEKSQNFLDKAERAWSLSGGAVHHAGGGEAAKKKRICYYYQKGTCKRGDQCGYLHEGAPDDATADETAGKNGFDGRGRVVRCFTKGCGSKDHRISECTHPNKRDGFQKRKSKHVKGTESVTMGRKPKRDSSRGMRRKYIP